MFSQLTDNVLSRGQQRPLSHYRALIWHCSQLLRCCMLNFLNAVQKLFSKDSLNFSHARVFASATNAAFRLVDRCPPTWPKLKSFRAKRPNKTPISAWRHTDFKWYTVQYYLAKSHLIVDIYFLPNLPLTNQNGPDRSCFLYVCLYHHHLPCSYLTSRVLPFPKLPSASDLKSINFAFALFSPRYFVTKNKHQKSTTHVTLTNYRLRGPKRRGPSTASTNAWPWFWRLSSSFWASAFSAWHICGAPLLEK